MADQRTFDSAPEAPPQGMLVCMLVDEGLELLTEEESLELLSGAEVGRIGLTIGAM